jgi:hypothetical protein
MFTDISVVGSVVALGATICTNEQGYKSKWALSKWSWGYRGAIFIWDCICLKRIDCHYIPRNEIDLHHFLLFWMATQHLNISLLPLALHINVSDGVPEGVHHRPPCSSFDTIFHQIVLSCSISGDVVISFTRFCAISSPKHTIDKPQQQTN